MTLFSCATRVTYIRFEIEAIRPPQAPVLIYSISVVAQNSRGNMRKNLFVYLYQMEFYNPLYNSLSFPNDFPE